MSEKKLGEIFLFSKDVDYSEIENGSGYSFSDGSAHFDGDDGTKIVIYSDGGGYFEGADGSKGYRYSDGSGYFEGADGSKGQKYSDGSGYFEDASGNSESYFSESDDESDNVDENSIDSDLASLTILATEALLYKAGSGIAKGLKNAYVQYMKEEKIKEIKKKRWLKKHWKGLTFGIVSLVLLLVLLITFLIYKQLIPIKYEYEELIGKNYEVVVEKLNLSGFSNVSAEEIADLSLQEEERADIVTEIIIKDKLFFSADTKLFPTEEIKVIYHTLEKIYPPLTSKNVKDKYIQK